VPPEFSVRQISKNPETEILAQAGKENSYDYELVRPTRPARSVSLLRRHQTTRSRNALPRHSQRPLANLAAEWNEAIAKRPKPKLLRRLLAPTPVKQQTTKTDKEPQIDAALKVLGKENFAERLGEALEQDVEPEPHQEVPTAGEWLPRKLGSAPVLGRQTPLANAKAFVLHKLYLHKDAELKLSTTYSAIGVGLTTDTT
jgi:hypothetical protein